MAFEISFPIQDCPFSVKLSIQAWTASNVNLVITEKNIVNFGVLLGVNVRKPTPKKNGI